jgi:hypothetical protein
VGSEWLVKPGDTLYAVGRAFFPGDARQQARLRKDIVRLNPDVFSEGVNNMNVGVKLKLPDYVLPKPVQAPEPVKPPAPVEPVQAPVVQPVVPATPEPLAPAPPKEPVEEKVEPEPPQIQPQPVVEQPAAAARTAETAETTTMATSAETLSREGRILLSLGYSWGGDVVVPVNGRHDITGGSGGHIRFGYERVPSRGSGYRIALGYQIDLVRGNTGDATYTNNYVQLAYQYRTGPVLLGIGASAHSRATSKVKITSTVKTEYDSAVGGLAYIEYVGRDNDSAFGLGYTNLELDEKGSSNVVDASRIELYYSWKFNVLN